MKIACFALSAFDITPMPWYGNWVWGLPLIVLTVVIHVSGLLVIDERILRVQTKMVNRHRYSGVFVVVTGTAAMSTAVLHGVEGALWAIAYRLVGALPDYPDAVLYSLSAMTTYGHANLFLEKHWQVMGALEALNGMLLFGLTTAFLFGIIQRASEFRGRRNSR
jgi:hypothetical protein